jgi:hypothetical protein
VGMGATILDGATVSTCSSAHFDLPPCLRSVGAKSPKCYSSSYLDVSDCAAYCSSNIIVHRFGRSYDFCIVLILTGWPHRIVLSSLE